MNYRDFWELFRDKYPSQFAASHTYTDFCKLIRPGLGKLLLGYSWGALCFRTEKEHPGHGLHKCLHLPEVHKLADMFVDARLSPVPIPGLYFVSGAPSLHVGGKRKIRQFDDDTVVRSHHGTVWMSTYAGIRKNVVAAVNTYGLPEGLGSFEIIKREDGLLVIARGARSIGDCWLALVPHTETLVDLMSDADREVLAREKAADQAAWACVRDDGTLDPSIPTNAEIIR